MAKTKLLYPGSFSSEGSLRTVNQINAFFEDMSRHSGWMEIAIVSGFTSGSIVPPGTAVRLQSGAANVVPFSTGRDDPLTIVQKGTETLRADFLGLTLDEFQAGHFELSRILLRGRLEFSHSFTHGDLVYLSGSDGGLSDAPYQGGEVPIGEWLNSTSFVGIHLNPSIV